MTAPTVTIAGTKYLLKFTFLAFLRMQEEYGVNVFGSDAYIPSPRNLAILIWGGTLHHNLKLDPKQIAASMTMADAGDANGAVANAIKESLPPANPPTVDAPGPVTG